MTVNELMRKLAMHDRDKVVVCADEGGGWDNIQEVKDEGATVRIVFGGGSPFSDERSQRGGPEMCETNKKEDAIK